MKAVVVSLVALFACSECSIFGTTLYDSSGTTYTLYHQTTFHMRGGRRGPLHPAVIEYVFGAAEAPWAVYYDTYLFRDKSNADMRKARKDAQTTAGSGQPVTGHHYARARGRALSKYVNKGLSMAADEHVGIEILCCKTVNRDSRRLERRRLRAVLLSNPRSAVVMLQWRDGRTSRVLTWDLAQVPGAFDPSVRLDYETVAATIEPLHPPQRSY